MFSLLVSCLSVCIYKESAALFCITLLLPLAVSLFAKHREPAVPGVGSGGGVDAAEREPGSSVDHKAFTQQIYKLALIIIIPICLLLRLCYSTVHLRLQWSKKTDRRAYRSTYTYFYLLLSTWSIFTRESNWWLWKLFRGLTRITSQHLTNIYLTQWLRPQSYHSIDSSHASRLIHSTQV